MGFSLGASAQRMKPSGKTKASGVDIEVSTPDPFVPLFSLPTPFLRHVAIREGQVSGESAFSAARLFATWSLAACIWLSSSSESERSRESSSREHSFDDQISRTSPSITSSYNFLSSGLLSTMQ